MNGDRASVAALTRELAAGAGSLKHCDAMIFPPHVYLAQIADELRDTAWGVGAQDVDARDNGAVTGGISAAMLADIGCRFVLVGHSERRALFGEDNETIARKFEQCIEHKLSPILCVGESLAQRKAGITLDVVQEQLRFVANRVGAAPMTRAMVAYEPVWAIGTGESATPGQIEEVHGSLRQCLTDMDDALGAATGILYGGSVTPDNAPGLFAIDNVDGALVGGASLMAGSFLKICQAAGQSVAG